MENQPQIKTKIFYSVQKRNKFISEERKKAEEKGLDFEIQYMSSSRVASSRKRMFLVTIVVK